MSNKCFLPVSMASKINLKYWEIENNICKMQDLEKFLD